MREEDCGTKAELGDGFGTNACIVGKMVESRMEWA